jgi:SAM-dependent methyltransferase
MKKMGMKVLHPGGLEATEILAQRCGISRDTTVLDVGCGRGSSSVLLAQKYGCKVVGVDLDQGLLMDAQTEARRIGVLDRVSFRVADILDLPFDDGAFDGAIVQAMLIFTEKPKALQQLIRKIRPNGFVGVLELAWKQPPPPSIAARAADVLCEVVVNAETDEGWISLLRRSGLTVIFSELRDVDYDFNGMLRNEGLLSVLKISAKSIVEADTRKKNQEITDLFRDAKDYLGYGIYVGQKDRVDRSPTIDKDTRAMGHSNHREI